jgi:hypothetical protein
MIFDRPYLPDGIPQLSIRDLCVGDSRVEFFLERHAGTVRIEVMEKQGKLDVTVR